MSEESENLRREETKYEVFLASKVEAGRASMRASIGRSSAEVETKFAALRDGALRALPKR